MSDTDPNDITPLVKKFDEIMGKAQFISSCEKEFLTFVQHQEDMRKRWLEVVEKREQLKSAVNLVTQQREMKKKELKDLHCQYAEMRKGNIIQAREIRRLKIVKSQLNDIFLDESRNNVHGKDERDYQKETQGNPRQIPTANILKESTNYGKSGVATDKHSQSLSPCLNKISIKGAEGPEKSPKSSNNAELDDIACKKENVIPVKKTELKTPPSTKLNVVKKETEISNPDATKITTAGDCLEDNFNENIDPNIGKGNQQKKKHTVRFDPASLKKHEVSGNTSVNSEENETAVFAKPKPPEENLAAKLDSVDEAAEDSIDEELVRETLIGMIKESKQRKSFLWKWKRRQKRIYK